MSKLSASVRSFLHDESGPTTVEYAVLLAVIIIACIGAVLSTGDVQNALFFDTADVLGDSVNPK
ncbi:MAG: Flp family type IVb pilin [Pirellulaceae bacterium]